MKNYLLIILAIAAQTAMAQDYQLIVTSVSHSGKCGMTNKYDYDGLGGALWNAISNQQSQQFNGKIYSSKQLCEASLHSMSGTFDGCTTKVSGYCRPLGGVDASIGSANVLGVNQGSSFYSTNGANEIRDWSNDDMERMVALNKGYQEMPPSMLTTGDDAHDQMLAMLNDNNQDLEDYMIVGGSRIPVSVLNKPFVPLNMRDENGNIALPNEYYLGEVMNPNDERWNYFLEKEFTDELHSEYFQEKHINIEEALYKEDKTEYDETLLQDFQKWKEQKAEDAELYMKMAIYSDAVYEDGHKELLQDIDSKILSKDDFPPEHPMYRFLLLAESCNNERLNQGFHVDVFQDNETGQYTVAFRGTEFPSGPSMAAEILSRINIIDIAKGYYKLNKELIMGYSVEKSSAKVLDAVLGDMIKDIADGNTDRLPPDFKDLSTDVSQAIGKVLTQYKMSIELGDVIGQISESYPDIKFCITGHSMGGGQGIIASLVSGQPAYVFNPAGVHEETYKYAEVSEKITAGNYKIHKFVTDDDILTNLQESKGYLGSALNKFSKTLAEAHGAEVKKSVPTAIATETHILHTGKNHKMFPMVQLLREKHNLYRQKADQKESISGINIYMQ